jgi:putative transposase
MVFHALNRGVGRMKIFSTDRDYQAFEETMEETLRLYAMRIVAYCLMPNHWHFVLWPENDGDLSAFLQRLTNTHTQRWQRAKRKVGYGHLYQGRFKSFPVETDEHFYTVVRYVERNALRANLVERAEAWRWGSLWRRVNDVSSPLLSPWPLPELRNWIEIVNQPQTEAELAAIRRCIQRGCPYGHGDWIERTAKILGLESTLRPRGRPRIKPADG